MRIISILFSFYMLWLALVPCHDKEDAMEWNTATDFFTVDNHSQHAQDIETCSPFCVCSCCGQTVAIQMFHSTFLKPFVSPKAQESFVLDNYLPSFSASHWQPPKIS